MDIMTVKDLTFTYPNEDRPTVDGISLSFQEGSFNLICGATGSGKTTLLRLFKKEISPKGSRTGDIRVFGQSIEDISPSVSAQGIGYLMQDPKTQAVTHTVWHELAFGLENMGLQKSLIRRRVSETAAFFGIGEWFDREVSSLSGGQLQLLNLAAVTVAEPRILLLDEPTSHLDPMAAESFLSALVRINRELGITVVVAEHDLERTLGIADRVIMLDCGRVIVDGKPSKALSLVSPKSPVHPALPSAVKIASALAPQKEPPLTAGRCRAFVDGYVSGIGGFPKKVACSRPTAENGEIAVSVSDLRFGYGEGDLALDGVDLRVYSGEIFCLVGGNGSGKTTLLKAIAGLIAPEGGRIKIHGKNLKKYAPDLLYGRTVAMLPQDVTLLFTRDRVGDEADMGPSSLFDLSYISDRHPYDISGGEQQKLALNKILSKDPSVILLDEPTKGLDGESKNALAEALRTLKSKGKTLIVVTHDLDFAAACADRCGMLFRGRTVCEEGVREFFEGNRFYTPSASRIAGHLLRGVLTSDEVVTLLKKEVENVSHN